MSLILLLAVVVVISVLLLLYKNMPAKPRSLKQGEIVNQNWKKDIVYLYQFRRNQFVPNPSPFALKVETFLRHAKISYKVDGELKVFSYEGTIPFIELNGVSYSDSDLIIKKLTEHFHLEHLEGDLTGYDQGVSRCIMKLCDQSLAEIMIHNRILRNYDAYMEASDMLISQNPNKNPIIGAVIKFIFLRNIKARAHGAGIGKHSDADIEKIASADLEALSKLLGKQKFLFSDSTPHNADLCAWAVMAESYYMPFDTPTTQIIKQHPNLVQFMDNMKEHFWPDWNDVPDQMTY